jgi:hypothetical protein
MSTSHSVALANAAADLDEVLDLAPDGMPHDTTVVQFQRYKAARPAPSTLNECVAPLSMALQFIDQAPCALTINGV